MANDELIAQLGAALQEADLLYHPFYQAWSAGVLTPRDLQAYAIQYYPQVAAFPVHLSTLHSQLPDGEMRRAVLRNLCDEEITGPCHSELWLDFAVGLGAKRDEVRNAPAISCVQRLIDTLRGMMLSPVTAFAALYACESQVPRVAKEKAHGLRRFYRADNKTCRYFDLHERADVLHTRVWLEQLARLIEPQPHTQDVAITTARIVGRVLWQTLDGIEGLREERMRSLGRSDQQHWRN